MKELTEVIDIYDKTTSLSELRDVLGWNTTHENTENLVMVLCQRVETLERRIARLEKPREGKTLQWATEDGSP